MTEGNATEGRPTIGQASQNVAIDTDRDTDRDRTRSLDSSIHPPSPTSTRGPASVDGWSRRHEIMRAFHGQGALTPQQIVDRMIGGGVDVGNPAQIMPLLTVLVGRGWLRTVGRLPHYITPRAFRWIPR